jgi:carboxymethylenebutenolidase
MCYDGNAQPPIPPGPAGATRAEDLVLTAADGARFAAYAAYPEAKGGAHILIYPDVRGLHQFYKDLTVRFAEVGIAALAMDYFGRTAGLTSRDESFEYMPHVQQLKMNTIVQDAQASLDHLRQGPGASQSSFATGFCIGGTITLYSGSEDLGLQGVIAFYSGFTRVLDERKGTALQAAKGMRVPVLGLYGGADAGITAEQREALDATLTDIGIEHEIVTYPGAPHGFFDRRAAEHAEASADAWRRVLAFIEAHKSAGLR